ncbi:pimeloyl-ACP methyl ester carboxylesterase [Aquitalea magnusonii]|uniref:Pimeloyl-ACP methyl ester carboxylesterase n=2 Tax=Aquitalea magnusonii TaxID=332411 RepID=A0A318JEZ8_9NEIS|nr:alpha/beta hydrolase [Aquitalea magnusonii]PXX45614.1 pimeloyl-ACP methyl ester carboxylesterase [Aquitalea magnusonii]
MITAMNAYLIPLLLVLAAVLLACCFPSATGQYMVRAYLRLAGFRSRRLRLEQGELAFLEGGQGSNVLLIHGFGGDGPASWGRVMAGLIRRHHVLVPDLLWFGRSHAASAPSLMAQADALEALIRARIAGPVQLVGLSYGGFVALELARRLPQQVSQLVIMASPGMVYTPEDQQDLLARARVASAEQLFVPADPQGVARMMAMVGSPLARAPQFLLKDVWQFYYRDRAPQLRALMQELATRQEQHLERFSQPLAMPVAVIWGSQDEIFPLDIGQRLALLLDAPLITIDGGTHVLPVVFAVQTLAALQDILQGNSPQV